MKNEIIEKKLEQTKLLLKELKGLLVKPFSLQGFGMIIIRAAERDFQLIVDTASDINMVIIQDKTGKIPENYHQAFADLEKLGIFDDSVLRQLIQASRLRNILVHDYDFEEDFKRFYSSAKFILPAFEQYIKTIIKYINK